MHGSSSASIGDGGFDFGDCIGFNFPLFGETTGFLAAASFACDASDSLCISHILRMGSLGFRHCRF